MQSTRSCSFPGCEDKYEAKGLCGPHYKQQWRGETVRPRRPRNRGSFESQIDFSGECWIWMGVRSGRYGILRVDGKTIGAHREAYRRHYGIIPDGTYVDHLCHTTLCVRPDHLRAATPKQNGENRAGAARHSRSGARGVQWDERKKKWAARVVHNGRSYRAGMHETIEAAAAAAAKKRSELFTPIRAGH